MPTQSKAATASKATRSATSADLLGLTFVSDPQLSPAQDLAAVVVTRIVAADGGTPTVPVKSKAGKDAKPPRYQSNIEVFSSIGKGRAKRRQLTRGKFMDSKPRFSPDGSEMAFLSVREEGKRPQLFLISMQGGEAEPLTKHGAGVAGFEWHPNGKQLAYLSRGDWEDTHAKEGKPRRITSAFWRADGGGVLPTEPAQLYLISSGGGKARKLTEFTEQVSTFAFSPDGETVYVVLRHPDKGFDSFKGDLLALDVASGKSKLLLEGVRSLSEVIPSPDGSTLAYTAPAEPDNFLSPSSVWLAKVKKSRGSVKLEGQPERLTDGKLEVYISSGGDSHYGDYPGTPTWLSDGSLLVLTNREGRTNLVRVLPDGKYSDVQEEQNRVVSAYAVLPGSDPDKLTALFLAETPVQPGELHVLRGGEERRISSYNDAWARKLALTMPQGPFEANKAKVPFWVIDPVKPRKDWAAVVQVHGGPHTNYGYGFNFEFQLMASRGFAVIFGNPRGSSSYGYTFMTAMLGKYGSVDADDVMDIAEAGVKQLSRAKAPLHLTGGSYGGFMTNWLVGKTNRFKSAVTQRSISNWTSMYGTSDIGPWFVEAQLEGVGYGAGVEKLWNQSPIKYADNITTPLLIVHSEEDYRCPIEQGEQLFSVLKRIGKTDTEFFRVPGESHGLSRAGRPDRRIARLEAIIGWFEKY